MQSSNEADRTSVAHATTLAKLAIGVSWLIISALGVTFIVSVWASRQQSELGWLLAGIFVVVMACVTWAGYRIYKSQAGDDGGSVAGPSLRTYKPAFTTAIVLQGIVLLLSALLLDGGRAFHVCLVAVPAFWAMAGLIVYRRRASPTSVDLAAIRYGYLAVVAIVGTVGPYLWTQFGRW